MMREGIAQFLHCKIVEIHVCIKQFVIVKLCTNLVQVVLIHNPLYIHTDECTYSVQCTCLQSVSIE